MFDAGRISGQEATERTEEFLNPKSATPSFVIFVCFCKMHLGTEGHEGHEDRQDAGAI